MSHARISCRLARLLRRSSPHVGLEELECRVLLSASLGDPGAPIYARDMPVGPAVVSTPQPPTVYPGVTSVLQSLSPGNYGTRAPATVLMHLHLPAVTDSPMLLVISTHQPDGFQGTSLADADQSMVSVEGTDWASATQSAPITSVVTFADANSPGGDYGTPVATGSGSAPAVSIPARAMGWVTVANPATEGSMSFPGPPGGQNWPGAADEKRLDLTGTLDPGETAMTFQIPVAGMNDALGLNLDQTGGTGGMVPVFGQMELLNPSGTTIEQASPPAGAGTNMLQALTVLLHNATTNSRLQIQVVAAEPSSGAIGSSPGTEAGTTAAPSQNTNFNVSFVLEIQRQDLVSPTQETTGSVPTSFSVGTLIVGSSPQSGSSVGTFAGTTEAPVESTTAEEQVAPTAAVAASATEPAEPTSESFDNFNFRVLTGPLASRTASPLGPTLASIDAEATQPVDRDERAMSQEIKGLPSLEGETSVAWRSRHSDGESLGLPADRPGHQGYPAIDDGPVVDAPGNGGYPMKVTSQGRSHQSEVPALWATLPSFADSGSSASSPEQTEIAIGDLALDSATVDRSLSDFSQAGNYVKAACGLAFGLMMTSGPLFPDLLGRLPRRVPRWLTVLRSPSSRNDAPASRRFTPRKISAWLRARLSAR